MNINKIKTFLNNIPELQDMLKELSLNRNDGKFDDNLYQTFLSSGIVYIDNLEQFYNFFVEVSGNEPDYYGYEPYINRQGKEYENIVLFNGYLIPCFDHIGDLLYFINYNPERDPKYLIAYPKGLKETLSGLKVFGLEDTRQALEENRLYVTEGTFDRLRLKSEGLACISTMGTLFTPYFLHHIKRFDKVVYIGDNDQAGMKAYRDARKKGAVMMNIKVPKGKDIDELGKRYPRLYKDFIEEIKQI